MIDTGDIVYRDLNHKQRYQKHPEQFQMHKITFDDQQNMSRIVKIINEKTGQVLCKWRAREIAEELGCQYIG